MGETYESSNGLSVTVHDVRIAKLIRSKSVGSSTHLDVACLDGHQFAIVNAEATDSDGNSVLTEIQFALEIDNTQYPQSNQQWYWAFPPDSYNPPGMPAFPAPVTSADTVAVVLTGGTKRPVRWKLSTKTVKLISQSPEFRLRSLNAPDSVDREQGFEATFTVANIGDRDGRFIVEFGAGPLSDHSEIVIDIPSGDERTRSMWVDPDYPESADEIEVSLEWGCDQLYRSVTLKG